MADGLMRLQRATYVSHRIVKVPPTRFLRRETLLTLFISNLQPECFGSGNIPA